MKEELSVIKPKALPDFPAYVVGDTIILDFGYTRIYKKFSPTVKTPPYFIAMKHLFSDYFDQASSLPSDWTIDMIPAGSWLELPINVLDANVFNSVASAGNDAYWIGKLAMLDDSLRINVAGLLYVIQYEMSKVSNFSAVFSLNWEAFYYLYVLFKDVTAKNVGTLKVIINEEDPRVAWITDNEETFYIRVHDDGFLEEQSVVLSKFESNLSSETFKGTSALSKKLLGSTGGSLVKHLYKPFKDSLEHSESERLDRYTDGAFYTLYMSKVKP